MKSPYDIIVQPHITEKSVALSYGSAKLSDEENVRTYTFIVNGDANKHEIAAALESIYNADKKKKAELIEVAHVRTVVMKGKTRRVGARRGKKADRKKAYITLSKGQKLEDYGV